jgi:hypothetical protein
VFLYICVTASPYEYACTSADVCIRPYKHSNVDTCPTNLFAHACTYTLTHPYTHIDAHTNTNTHTYFHTFTHVHTSTRHFFTFCNTSEHVYKYLQAGVQVLHMDRNNYYGGESASLSLTQV